MVEPKICEPGEHVLMRHAVDGVPVPSTPCQVCGAVVHFDGDEVSRIEPPGSDEA